MKEHSGEVVEEYTTDQDTISNVVYDARGAEMNIYFQTSWKNDILQKNSLQDHSYRRMFTSKIFVPYWLVNHTGFDLLYAKSLNTHTSKLVPGQDNYDLFDVDDLNKTYEKYTMSRIRGIDDPPWYALAGPRKKDAELTNFGFRYMLTERVQSWVPELETTPLFENALMLDISDGVNSVTPNKYVDNLLFLYSAGFVYE